MISNASKALGPPCYSISCSVAASAVLPTSLVLGRQRVRMFLTQDLLVLGEHLLLQLCCLRPHPRAQYVEARLSWSSACVFPLDLLLLGRLRRPTLRPVGSCKVVLGRQG